MPNFKVVNKTTKFTTQGEIDFIDLSDKVQKESSIQGSKTESFTFFLPTLRAFWF